MAKCNICGSESDKVFSKTIMKKYKGIDYHKCPNCGFLQTDKPFWVEESYESEAISIDPDRLKRNTFLRDFLIKFIDKFFDKNIEFLDFAGGEGILTRTMRDRGYKCFNYDKYSKPLYSSGYNLKKLDRNFDFILSSEVMEHIEDPYLELDDILKHTDNYFFTTCIQVPENLENWFYLIPDNGQHISFYTTNALAYLAEKYNMNYYSDGWWCHFFTRKDLGDGFKITSSQHLNEDVMEAKTFHKMKFNKNSRYAEKLSEEIEVVKKKKKNMKQRLCKSLYKKFTKAADFMKNQAGIVDEV